MSPTARWTRDLQAGRWRMTLVGGSRYRFGVQRIDRRAWSIGARWLVIVLWRSEYR